MKNLALLALVLAACGSDTKPNSNIDASGSNGQDGSNQQPDASGNSITITLSGKATEDGQNGSTALAGVAISAFKTSDQTTPVAMTTTAADGTYSMMVTAVGALDGYIKATKSGETDTYLFAPAPLTADFSAADVHMISSGNFQLLGALGQQAGKGMVILEVEDAQGNLVMGATVSSTPAGSKVTYSDAQGLPTSTTATAADGRAFDFSLPPNVSVSLSAAKSGATFKSHSVLTFPDAITTTIVTE